MAVAGLVSFLVSAAFVLAGRGEISEIAALLGYYSIVVSVSLIIVHYALRRNNGNAEQQRTSSNEREGGRHQTGLRSFQWGSESEDSNLRKRD